MTDPCCEYTLLGLTVNESTDGIDRLWTGNTQDAITGLDGRPVRQQRDPKGQASGVILHDAFWDARVIVFKGEVQIVTADVYQNTDAYRTALMALQSAWVSAWEGALDTTFALAYTPSGQGAQSIDCKIWTPALQFGGTLVEPTFTFGLISAED